MKKSSIPVGLAAGPDISALTAERRLTAVCRHKGHSDELSGARRSIPLADVCRDRPAERISLPACFGIAATSALCGACLSH